MKDDETLPGLYAPVTERFSLQDVFFSRTDDRGVITAGNGVFHEVSAYVWPELVGKPHKIIRHPDMPKGVFQLLWDTIKSGAPVGGYVLNQARDEAVYWVFAVMMPVEGGYLSVRLKPSSDRLEQVKPIYERLRLAEMQGSVSPEESAAELLKSIQELGFDDYKHFMADSLSKELLTRSKSLGTNDSRANLSLDLIATAVGKVEENGRQVAALFSRTEQIPYNMRLQAGRLEGSDGPISVISENHRQMSQSLTASVGDFRSAAALGAGPVREAVFGMGTTTLIRDIIKQFESEKGMTKEDKEKELNTLRSLETYYTRQGRAAVSELSLRIQQFGRMCRDMRRMLSGLEMTRIMCKIERSKAVGDTEGLDEIVNRLLHAEKSIGEVMTEIDNSIRDIMDASERLLRSELAATRTIETPQKLSA